MTEMFGKYFAFLYLSYFCWVVSGWGFQMTK